MDSLENFNLNKIDNITVVKPTDFAYFDYLG